MPRYEVYLDDKSSYPVYAENEEVVKTEIYYPYDNRVHSPEQSAGQLQHTRLVITTRYIPKKEDMVGFIGPITFATHMDAVNVVNSYHKKEYSRRVASAPRSSPKRGKKTVSRSTKKSRSTRQRCPPGFRYDFKKKMCVKIKGRTKYAKKKNFKMRKMR